MNEIDFGVFILSFLCIRALKTELKHSGFEWLLCEMSHREYSIIHFLQEHIGCEFSCNPPKERLNNHHKNQFQSVLDTLLFK
jgi:hypothetical protein